MNSSIEVVKTADGSRSIPLSKIQISDLNPRNGCECEVSSLVKDIKTQGILQPVKLRKKGDSYELIFGVRRFKALKFLRGEEGEMHAGEYTIVDWNDDKCLKAAVSENRERADMSPLDEGRFYSGLVIKFGSLGEKVTDKVLEEKTGEDSRRINDLRNLADRFSGLPQSWKDQLSRAPNSRSDDKELAAPTITATHWKVVRGLFKTTVSSTLLEIMEKAVTDGWASAKLEKAVQPFKIAANSAETKPADGTPKAAAQAAAPVKAVTTRERHPDADHDYKVMARGLKIAIQAIVKDDALAKLIRDALEQVEKILAEQAAKAEQAKAEMKANRDAESAEKAAQKAAEKAAKKAGEAAVKKAKVSKAA